MSDPQFQWTTAGILVAGLGVMATVVGVLWRSLMGQFGDVKTRLDSAEKEMKACQEDRLKIWQHFANMNQGGGPRCTASGHPPGKLDAPS